MGNGVSRKSVLRFSDLYQSSTFTNFLTNQIVVFSGPNVQGWASGWGVIDPNNKAVQAKKLQKIDVYTMPQRECEDYYDNDGSVTDTMMCAKSYKGMKGIIFSSSSNSSP